MLELAQPFAGVAYRSHEPRWSFLPTSGEGAARHGGRFNPQGQATLYLSLTQMGALIESQQGFPKRAKPKLICSYDVDMQNIIDLTAPQILQCLAVEPDKMASCGWLLESKRGQTPYTWQLFYRLYENGVNGIIVNSYAPGAAEFKNLVLWRWSNKKPNQVCVIDPYEQLPKNQMSWRH